ncbi:MAG: class I SAM-dependent rRNA methyltransferase [Acidobacteriota bacterium]
MSALFEPERRRRLILQRGRERMISNRHPWIFSGAIHREHGSSDAAVADLYDSAGTLLASGFYSAHSQIRLRVMSFGEPFQLPLLEERIVRAFASRKALLDRGTDALRLLNSEGDLVSGLIVDAYGDTLVVEIGSAGLDALRGEVLRILQREKRPRSIVFKNDLPTRKKERISLEDVVVGEAPGEVVITENGIRFVVTPGAGQKTGFFLDQRENRSLARTLSGDGEVLNLFSYSGAFGVYAAAGGATMVEEVDISGPAIELARRNHQMLGSPAQIEFRVTDVFDHLRKLENDGRQFDLVVCDPPAFARSRGDVDRASRGYKDINLHALRLVRPGGHLMTFSCSGHIDATLFQKIIFGAALDAPRNPSIVGRLTAGRDHPVSIDCPEGEYLKGLLLQVR